MRRSEPGEVTSAPTLLVPNEFKTSRTCTHKITNLPTQVNISDNLYFVWNCNNMYTLFILDKNKYLICSLRVTERVKCGHPISII